MVLLLLATNSRYGQQYHGIAWPCMGHATLLLLLGRMLSTDVQHRKKVLLPVIMGGNRMEVAVPTYKFLKLELENARFPILAL